MINSKKLYSTNLVVRRVSWSSPSATDDVSPFPISPFLGNVLKGRCTHSLVEVCR